jgi:dTDP-4-dehydrorhamnose 3,5-epimerase-like enzyme
MTLATIRSRALSGMSAPAVLVEVHLANGLPSFTIVGLPDTEVQYKCSDVYAPDCDGGIRWNDPTLAIDWGVAEPVLSAKDQVAPLLADWQSPFEWGAL